MNDKSSLPYSMKKNELRRTPITEKTLQASHFVQEVASFQPHSTCPIHTHDYISHVCLNCDYQCLCGTCLKEGNHKTHNIKNIDKSVKIVDRILNQYVIRLRSKSDILTLLHQSLSAHKTQIYQEFSDYKKHVEDKFDSLVQAIVLRQQQILKQIKNEEDAYFQRIQYCMKQINQQTRFSISLIDMISESIEKLEPTSLCLFFVSKKGTIEEALDEQKIQIFKSGMPDLKIDANFSDFDSITEKINELTTRASDKKLIRSISPKRILKKAGIKNMGKTVIRGEKARDSFTGIQTPKDNRYIESHKDIVKFFRSPNKHNRRGFSSGKLMSMPESPDRPKQVVGSKNPSPTRMYGQQLKKKVRKYKK